MFPSHQAGHQRVARRVPPPTCTLPVDLPPSLFTPFNIPLHPKLTPDTSFRELRYRMMKKRRAFLGGPLPRFFPFYLDREVQLRH